MNRKPLAALALAALLVPLRARAAVITLPPPSNPNPGLEGTGACARARQPIAAGSIGSIGGARALLALGSSFVREHTFVFAVPDFTNGTLVSHGDFPFDVPLPFSTGGVPSGSGNVIAIEVRGTVRVTGPSTWTFAVRSDDGFTLSIQDTVVLAHPDPRDPAVDTQPVIFPRAGRYPFTLVYYENYGDAVLEWSRVAGDQGAVADSKDLPMSGFTLMPTSAITTPDTDDACGPMCTPCSSDTRCEGGVCVPRMTPDAGTITDAGTIVDAGMNTDAGTLTDVARPTDVSSPDAGTLPMTVDAGPSNNAMDAGSTVSFPDTGVSPSMPDTGVSPWMPNADAGANTTHDASIGEDEVWRIQGNALCNVTLPARGRSGVIAIALLAVVVIVRRRT